jgi:hypothetical protein
MFGSIVNKRLLSERVWIGKSKRAKRSELSLSVDHLKNMNN